MKNILTLIIIIIISCGYTYSQTINGIVYGSNVKGRETLEGASIKWINTKKGALTGSEGKFELYPEGITDRRVIVSYVGYTPDTVDVSKKSFVEIELKSSFSTQQIVVEDEQKSSFISNDNSKTEVITQMELKKDACCDLSGCFGKNASIDVAVTDILTNTKELKVLGLEGSYTQILIDNMPIMTGLVTKYGVTSIPGTLINKINISKGSNSVLQGYESISGIMNVLLKDYGTSDRLLVNGFINSGLEKQFNVNGTAMVKKNLSTIAAFQTVQEMKRMDENGDGFLDVPLTRRYMFYNKWRYGSSEEDKTSVMVGLKYLNERRVGGQKGFNYDTDLGSGIIYGQTVNLENGDIYGRMSRVLKNENQIKLFTSGGFFNQDSYYGTTNYTAKQRDFYFNGLYEFEVYKKSFLRFGASYRYENIDENVRFLAEVPKTYAGNYEKLESIPGVFTEASFEQKDLNLSVIAGLRLDFHNKYNLITTPRILIRYQLTPETVVRASFGTGFRTVNLFSEYPSLLGSGKDIVFNGEMNPERMINYGIDMIQYFNLGSVAGNINLDYYRTDFSNKVIPEYDVIPAAVVFSNFGRAGSDVLQIETNTTLFRNFDFKLAYKFIDLFYYKDGQRLEQPFNAKHRIVSGLSYSSARANSWIANVTLQWFGTQVLPSTQNDPVQYQRPSESEPYTLINMQLTKNFRNFELYAGVENVLDFMQPNPIVSADNPFSRYFDTSFIWGPTRGRDFYLGIRFMLQ